jgi:hypothetical protein
MHIVSIARCIERCTMKKLSVMISVFSLVGFAAFAAPSSKANGAGLATAPGQASNFYRGVTTLAPVVVKDLASSTSEVVSSDTQTSTEVSQSANVVDTRFIGVSPGNPTGNKQDKVATTTTTTTTAVTTSVVETTNVYDVTTTIGSHRGAPVSNGKELESVVTSSTQTEVSQSTEVSTDTSTSSTTVVGDWQAAYNVPSGTK